MSQIVDDLRQVAIEIKTETQVGGNTAARVGGAFERVADALEGTQQIEDMDAAVAAVQQAAQENEQTIHNIVNSLAVVQTTGQSASDVMSQKAVTEELNTLSENLQDVVNIIDSDTKLVNNSKSAFSTESLNLVIGKTYRVHAYANADHASKIDFYLRDNAGSTTVLFNLGTPIAAHEYISQEVIYTCKDDSAQYWSCWTATKMTAHVKLRFEEIDIKRAASEKEFEENVYEEVPSVLQQGTWNQNLQIETNNNRLSSPLIKIDGDFFVNIGNGYHFSVLYFTPEFAFDKYSNPGFWLDSKWKDNYNGYIAVVVRNDSNSNILPSAETGLHVFASKNSLSRETYNMELGAINGGYDVDSDKGCRSVGTIPIVKGETLFIVFDLAQVGGNWGGLYKYLNGEFVGTLGGNTAINNGFYLVLTCDGTFNEIRFRVLGTATWTVAQANNSFIYVAREKGTKLTDAVIALQNDFVANDDVFNAIIAQTYKYNAVSGSYNPLQTQGILTLMQFSDIHGDVFAVKKALEYKEKYADYIHDVIHTGDAVAMYNTDLNPFTIPENGGSIINLIGNHDAWEQGTYDYEMTEQEVYNTLLANNIASWGVEYTEGKNYYYKDYTTPKVRVIFLDSIHWHGYVAVGDSHDAIRLANAANEDASAQKTWFETTLASAKAAGYAVVCVTHYTPEKGINFLKGTGFCAYRTEESGVITDGWFARDEIFDCVDTFISSGGKFMCWLMGHCHQDLAGILVDHPNQFMIGVDRGGSTSFSRYDRHLAGSPSAYVFNVTTFDSTNNLVKITRLGNSYDVYMQSKKTLCYDLTNKKIIYNT